MKQITIRNLFLVFLVLINEKVKKNFFGGGRGTQNLFEMLKHLQNVLMNLNVIS